MMKKNEKRKNSTMKKLIPAAGMLALSASMLATSTYAWFTLNKEVTVTGMQVNTTVGSNLMIAKTTTDATTALTDGEFKTSDVDIMSALLEPVSTIDGKAFWYTSTGNVNGLGDAMAETYIDYNATGIGVAGDTTKYNNAFSENYGILKTSTPDTAKGYIDYAFQLKANNTTGSDQYINVTGFDLVYGGTEATEHAYRAAMFVEDIGTALKATSGDVGTLKTILAPTGTASTYYFTSGKAVKDDDELDSVQELSTAANIATVSSNSTHYYKVVVRLWLEGEDQTCNNSVFNTLKDKWALSLKINMEDATGGVSAINRTATATKTAIAVGTTVASTPIVIDNVNYYEITGVTLGSDGSTKLYKSGSSAAAVAAGDTIYKIVNNHPIDVTNQINITTT